jgi:uncharacterized protein (DUF427 family)
MPTAVWKGVVLAESDQCIAVEGNWYFPPAAVQMQFLQTSDKHTVCGWKGIARYYDVVVDGDRNRDAAWYYPEPNSAAQAIAGYIAFWKGVTVDS